MAFSISRLECYFHEPKAVSGFVGHFSSCRSIEAHVVSEVTLAAKIVIPARKPLLWNARRSTKGARMSLDLPVYSQHPACLTQRAYICARINRHNFFPHRSNINAGLAEPPKHCSLPVLQMLKRLKKQLHRGIQASITITFSKRS